MAILRNFCFEQNSTHSAEISSSLFLCNRQVGLYMEQTYTQDVKQDAYVKIELRPVMIYGRQMPALFSIYLQLLVLPLGQNVKFQYSFVKNVLFQSFCKF